MLIQQSKPAEKDTQLYINGNNISYFISERGEGKTAETLRQAIYRGNVIVAPWEKPYEQYGFNRFCDNVVKQDYKITYLTLHQMEKISKEGLEEKSMAYMEKVLPKMADLREAVDSLESYVDASYWPVPSYGDLLFGVK